MTLFVDLRATDVGGICAAEPTLLEDSHTVTLARFLEAVGDREILFVAHGFNVDRRAGLEHLAWWDGLLELPASAVLVGVLWPGDSRWLPVLDYPIEGNEAIASGRLLARFIDRELGTVRAISFASHSLGARTVLECIKNLGRPVRRLILMAGAIENDCLVREYRDAVARDKVEAVSILASRSDFVLAVAFPIGNLLAQILMHGHPYDRTAIGRAGPAAPAPPNVRPGWQIARGWDYGHGDYLPGAAPEVAPLAPPVEAPSADQAPPVPDPTKAWKPAWSAGFVATRIR